MLPVFLVQKYIMLLFPTNLVIKQMLKNIDVIQFFLDFFYEYWVFFN